MWMLANMQLSIKTQFIWGYILHLSIFFPFPLLAVSYKVDLYVKDGNVSVG